MAKANSIHISITIRLYFLLMVILNSCRTAKNEIIITNNRLLQNNKIDTVYQKNYELKIVNNSLLNCLDSMILETESLQEFDKRIKPLFFITIKCDSTSMLNIKSTNDHVLLDSVVMDMNILKSFYGTFIYRGYQFLVWKTKCEMLHKEFFLKSGSIINIKSYAFYSKRTGNKINAYYNWEFVKKYDVVNKELIFRDKKFNPLWKFLKLNHK